MVTGLDAKKLDAIASERPPMKFSFGKVVARLSKLILPFGWSVEESVVRDWRDTQLKKVELWLAADVNDGTWIAPDELLRAVEIPYAARSAFKDDRDARALASVILQTHADFALLATRGTSGVEMLKTRELKQGIGTPFGAVFVESYPLQVWFGRKHKMLPAVSDADGRNAATNAINRLFLITDHSVEAASR